MECPLPIEIIIIDNASADKSLSSVENLPSVTIIKNTANKGFASACNQGIAQATTDYLLFLNPDCSFEKGAPVELLTALKADDKAGMAGGLLINPNGSEQGGARRAVPTPWRSFVRAFGLNYFNKRWPKLFFDFYLHQQPLPAAPTEMEAISGACMMVKRKAIADVGLWDEGYFLHCEDLDWCMRFRQKGWKILFVPSARVIHSQGSCSRSRPIFVEWHKHKGMIRFYLKFFRHQYPGILMWVVAIGVWFRFGLVAAYYSFKNVEHILGFGNEP
jgi:GT2 family glycosyltransferase